MYTSAYSNDKISTLYQKDKCCVTWRVLVKFDRSQRSNRHFGSTLLNQTDPLRCKSTLFLDRGSVHPFVGLTLHILYFVLCDVDILDYPHVAYAMTLDMSIIRRTANVILFQLAVTALYEGVRIVCRKLLKTSFYLLKKILKCGYVYWYFIVLYSTFIVCQ